MSDEKNANIQIPVDLTNPGQFFACCGLLELADRLWPGAEGWFESADRFQIRNEMRESTSFDHLCSKIMQADFSFLLSPDDRDALVALNERKAALKRQNKSLPANQEKERKRLNSKRIASGFKLGPPFDMRIDWWLIENCDGDHLKTWAGQQAIAGIANAIHKALVSVSEDDLFEHEALIIRDGEAVAPLSFDSGRVGTAQDIGYSSDKVGQPICCCVWTEFLTLIAIQRFALQPDSHEFFTYHAWHAPLPPSVAAIAARGLLPKPTGCEGRFRLAGRDSGNRYKAFQQATLTEWRF
jgi:CRISPR-associated protein Csb3